MSDSRAIRLPQLFEERLPNGVRVVVAQRPGVPLVAIRTVIAAGAALDPAHGHGLANLVTQVARRGTARRTGPQIDDRIEALGSELGAGVDEDASYFGLSAPAEAWPALVDVLADIIVGPTFPNAEWLRVRRREVAALAHVLDEPGAVADRAMCDAVYRGHPYGHPSDGRMRDMSGLRRSDAKAFHARWFSPELATMVIVGAIDPQRVLAHVRRRLGRWAAGEASAPVIPAMAPMPRAILVVDKRDVTQAQVRIASPAIARVTPEYFPALVANTVFGGGFTSRLMEAVRVNRGLSYGVRSRFAMSRAAGFFFMSSFTKLETTAELVQVLLDEARRFCDEVPTEEELERAKSYLSGLYPLSFETHDQIAEKLADVKLYGIPIEEVTSYREKVRAVDALACCAVARRYFPVDGGVIIAVGPAKRLAPMLERFGPVSVVQPRKLV